MKVGLIGAGRIGKIHAENIVVHMPRVQITRIADVAADKVRDWARGLGITQVSANARDVLDDPEIEAVIVCSSTDTHADMVSAAAAKGKHIFCEKPVDLTVATVKKALADVKKAGVKIQVGFNRRFDHNFRRIRDLVQQGAIGDPHIVRITSRDPAPPPPEYVKVSGGIFLDMTIHDFDMARYLAGSDAVEVYAKGAVLVDPAIGKAGDVDTAVVTLTFANGCLGVIDNSRKATYGYDQRVEVFGSKGALACGNDTPSSVTLSNEAGVCRRQAAVLLPRALPPGIHRRDERVLRHGAGREAQPRRRHRRPEAAADGIRRKEVRGGGPPGEDLGGRRMSAARRPSA